MEFPALKQAEEKLAAARKELHGVFAEAGPDLDMTKVKSLEAETDKVGWIRKKNAEIDDLAKDAEDKREIFKGANHAAAYREGGVTESGTAGDDRTEKTFTDLFMAAGLHLKTNRGKTADLSLKTLMSTTAGFAPDTPRGPIVVPIAFRPVELVDLIPKIQTNSPSVTWMEQTTRTNNAAETAEAAAKPEAVIVYTERTSVARKIAVTLPVTDEQLDDVPQIRSILEQDLVTMVRQRLSDQIAAGDGTGVNLTGILSTSGIQTQAKGADPTPDAVYKAMVKVMTGTGQAMPDAFVTNPLDWQDVRLLRTADGIYIWGNPSDAGPERIWGLQVVLAQGMTQNTGVVGAWKDYARLAIKQDIQVDIGLVNDDFSKNRQTLRAEMRAALMFLRPAAFASVTGI